MIRILVWQHFTPKTSEGKTLGNARIIGQTPSVENQRKTAHFSNTPCNSPQPSFPMSSKLPKALEPQRPALQNDFFTEKKHAIFISIQITQLLQDPRALCASRLWHFVKGSPKRFGPLSLTTAAFIHSQRSRYENRSVAGFVLSPMYNLRCGL